MALKNNCSLTVGKAQYGAGQETEGHGARNKSKVVRSFADPNKKTLLKALPKRQYSKHFRYGLGVVTEEIHVGVNQFVRQPSRALECGLPN